MAGRPNTKWMETMLAKHGSREAVREAQAAIGRKGGLKSRNGGFASEVVGEDGLTGYQRASVAGAKGGRIGRRGKKEVINEQV